MEITSCIHESFLVREAQGGNHAAVMQRVRVTLAPYGRTADQRAILTAGDGKFSFEVPKGKFVLTAEHRTAPA